MAVETRPIMDDAAVDAFAAGLRGALIRPDDPTYDTARKVYNGMNAGMWGVYWDIPTQTWRGETCWSIPPCNVPVGIVEPAACVWRSRCGTSAPC